MLTSTEQALEVEKLEGHIQQAEDAIERFEKLLEDMIVEVSEAVEVLDKARRFLRYG